MEKLDKVIDGLECCRNEDVLCKYNCPYFEKYTLDNCTDRLKDDALELLKAQVEKLNILRAELAEERERSARWVRESEPVVHAHWEGDPGDWHCSHCDAFAPDGGYEQTKRCPNCGAHMDEEVAE